MSASLQRLLGSLDRVRPSGAGWIACCPAHQDRSPSLSIKEQNGRILLHCFAGCSVDAISEALGLRVRDLFSEARPKVRHRPAIVRYSENQITSLRSRLTPKDRERKVTVVLASRANPAPAFARALALSVEGELVQVLFKEEE